MMRTPFPEHTLLQFLRSALQVHHRFVSGTLSRAESPIYVIGNPSADLDSIISALVYSYFANDRVPCDFPRPHVPVINLDKVSAGPELRRLRPEFAKALHLSKHDAGETSDVEESSMLKEHFLTVADFAAQLKQECLGSQIQADSVLVDWNALPTRSDNQPGKGKGALPGLPTVDFTVVGCIDHHTDEKFLPSIVSTQPLFVEPTGSCSSLVIAVLEKMGLWERSKSATANEGQMAKLAMVPILIDTANLTSKDKVTEFDTAAFDFLLPKATTANSWDASKFYTEIRETKQNSLELLTVDEILDRDYKEWTENSRQTDQLPLQIGICSMVKSIPWVVRKAGSSQAFVDSLKTFASQRKLDIVVAMTAFSSQDGQFSRELLVCALNARGVDALQAFVSDSSSQLGLKDWSSHDGDDHAQDIKDTLRAAEDSPLWTRLWVQTNVAQSRKQVAPLIRGAAASL
ncbi:hypothetical protein BDW59DRAFT_148544 [Aspergillus cavernicola]|uniref:DHHA2 domain-containing protein n=1 Tax=Aspergillus cavernicola TaxID=176166 RepID=A0ABR4I7J9_9EURO